MSLMAEEDLRFRDRTKYGGTKIWIDLDDRQR